MTQSIRFPAFYPGRHAWVVVFGAVLLALLSAAPARADSLLTGPEIMARSQAATGGDDGRAVVRFIFRQAGRKDRELRYRMVWKHFGTGARYTSKVLFFAEFPHTIKGTAYMGFLRPEGQGADDEWIYIPELRKVRKLTPRHNHSSEDAEDLFAHSVLARHDLARADPAAMAHTLLRVERKPGKQYVVESNGGHSPYARTLTWVSRDFLPTRVEAYDADGNLIKTITYTWTTNGGEWVWEKVVGVRADGSAETELTMSDVRINPGLKERGFSERSMQAGRFR